MGARAKVSPGQTAQEDGLSAIVPVLEDELAKSVLEDRELPHERRW
jgi:hypothetical protein